MWLGIDTGYLQRSSRPQLCSEPPPPMACTCTTLLAPWNGRPRCMHLALSGCITKCTIHLHAMHLSTTYSCSQTIFLEQDYNAPSIYIYAMHTLQGDIYARPLIFHILSCWKAANSMWRINTTPLPRQHTRMLLISHFCKVMTTK